MGRWRRLDRRVKTNTLQPAGNANRCQVATIIMRFSRTSSVNKNPELLKKLMIV